METEIPGIYNLKTNDVNIKMADVHDLFEEYNYIPYGCMEEFLTRKKP